MEWTYKDVSENQIRALDPLSIHPLLARLLVRSGIETAEEAEVFLDPKLLKLEDPFLITHMQAAVERLHKAITQKESVLVLGDYDVDGVTSTALLISILSHFGIEPDFIVPRRFEEGYGLTRAVINRALKTFSPSLFISLDCGTNSIDEVAFLTSQNIDVIIVDHHHSKKTLPQDAIIINPHVFDSKERPWMQLCSVGLVFKLAHALVKFLREKNNPHAFTIHLKDFLDIVALGTVADMVPLTGENRILTKFGLKQLHASNRPGLKALCKVSGISPSQIIQPYDVSFRLGPRINAGGRLAEATLPVQLLLEKKSHLCQHYASLLDSMNKERQDIELAITNEAKKQIHPLSIDDQYGIVLYGPHWHSGVLGIVAGKLSKAYHRPCIILGLEGDVAKGSGRSIPGIDLMLALAQCDALLQNWGGHPMAAGISLDPSKITDFRLQFNAAIQAQLPNGLPQPFLEITEWIPLSQLNKDLLEALDRFHPFGMNNPEPVFGITNVCLSSIQRFGTQHIKFNIPTGKAHSLSGIGWNMVHALPPPEKPLNLAIRFQWSTWGNYSIPQIQLIDWKLPAN